MKRPKSLGVVYDFFARVSLTRPLVPRSEEERTSKRGPWKRGCDVNVGHFGFERETGPVL